MEFIVTVQRLQAPERSESQVLDINRIAKTFGIFQPAIFEKLEVHV